MKTTLLAASLIAALAGVSRADGTNATSPAATSAPAEEFKIHGDPAKGAEIFKLYCVACHGEGGKGDGVTAAALNPKPRNFTDKAAMSNIPDKEIFTAIKEGGVAVGKSPMMTPWGPLLNDDQKIHDLAAFVRTLAK